MYREDDTTSNPGIRPEPTPGIGSGKAEKKVKDLYL